MKHTTLFRSILPLCIAGTALFFGACDDNEETEEIGSLLFESKNVTLALDETVQLRVRLYRPGSTENTWYDTTANPYNLQWSSGDPSVASVDAQGRLTGHAIGSTVIRCAMPDNSVHATTRVTVHDGTGESLAAELSRPFDDALVYSRSVYLQRNTIMQSFDVETDGTLWYLQLGGNDPELLYVLRGAPNESPKDYMMLRWFGHGTNFAVEEQGAERYIWIGSNGNKLSDGSYSQSNTVSRLKYSPDKNRKLDLCGGDTFFIKDKWNVHPAIDTDNDILCITASTTGVRDFIFYRLSDALATPLSKVTLRTQTYGGEDADSPQKTETRTIEAHDLTSIAPLGSFTISVPGKDNLSQYDFQGFDVQDGLLYFYEGEAAGKQPKSIAFVTVLDISGNIVVPRTQVGAINDVNALVEAGICSSDSNGYIYDKDGIKLDVVKEIKEVKRGRIKEYVDAVPTAVYTEGKGIWTIPCDIALPCATQNELNGEDAKTLLANGCFAVAEGANMPSTLEATELFVEKKILFMPGKAANAGGVATSGLEQSQNSLRMSWSFEEVDEKLHGIMVNIFAKAADAAERYGVPGNYVAGANIAGFEKVVEAMMAQGIV